MSAVVPLDAAGTAVFTTAALPASSFNVSAVYSGDSGNAGSVSPLLGQAVAVQLAVAGTASRLRTP